MRTMEPTTGCEFRRKQLPARNGWSREKIHSSVDRKLQVESLQTIPALHWMQICCMHLVRNLGFIFYIGCGIRLGLTKTQKKQKIRLISTLNKSNPPTVQWIDLKVIAKQEKNTCIGLFDTMQGTKQNQIFRQYGV